MGSRTAKTKQINGEANVRFKGNVRFSSNRDAGIFLKITWQGNGQSARWQKRIVSSGVGLINSRRRSVPPPALGRKLDRSKNIMR